MIQMSQDDYEILRDLAHAAPVTDSITEDESVALDRLVKNYETAGNGVGG